MGSVYRKYSERRKFVQLGSISERAPCPNIQLVGLRGSPDQLAVLSTRYMIIPGMF